MVTARTSSSGEMEMRAGGSGPTAIDQNNIKNTTPAAKTNRLLNASINTVGPVIIRDSPRNVVLRRLNCERTFVSAGFGRVLLNVAYAVLYKVLPMRLAIL